MPAHGQEYPIKPVRLVVGFSVGGPTDLVARAFADFAARALGQPFVVDNKPGANTILAAEAVAMRAADGYTLLFGATNHTMIPALYSKRVKFDAVARSRRSARVASAPRRWSSARPHAGQVARRFLDGSSQAARARRTVGTPGAAVRGTSPASMFSRAAPHLAEPHPLQGRRARS